jgi:hypothetical protein
MAGAESGTETRRSTRRRRSGTRTAAEAEEPVTEALPSSQATGAPAAAHLAAVCLYTNYLPTWPGCHCRLPHTTHAHGQAEWLQLSCHLSDMGSSNTGDTSSVPDVSTHGSRATRSSGNASGADSQQPQTPAVPTTVRRSQRRQARQEAEMPLRNEGGLSGSGPSRLDGCVYILQGQCEPAHRSSVCTDFRLLLIHCR